jgi:hypothetical protein
LKEIGAEKYYMGIDNNSYVAQAVKLLKNIVINGLPENSDRSFDIFSFNYTNPFAFRKADYKLEFQP